MRGRGVGVEALGMEDNLLLHRPHGEARAVRLEEDWFTAILIEEYFPRQYWFSCVLVYFFLNIQGSSSEAGRRKAEDFRVFKAAAAAGAEPADGPSRICGTAAVAFTAATIWQGGHTLARRAQDHSQPIFYF